jgi:hypothetical protein
MNERIKELVKQATTEEHDGFRYFDKAKFAELIVRECANIDFTEKSKGHFNALQTNWISNIITEHFEDEE